MRARLILGAILYLLPDAIFRFTVTFRHFRKSAKTLAIVRLDHIGDMVLFAQTCRSLVLDCKQKDTPSLIICHPTLVPLVKGWIPEAQIFGLDPKKLWQPRYRYRQLWRLQRFQIHTLFHPVVSHYQYLGNTAAIIRCVPCPITVGYQTTATGWRSWFNRISGWHYTHLLPAKQSETPNPDMPHEQDYHRAALTYFNAELLKTPLPTPVCATNWNFPTDQYILIAPGASHSMRQWPIGRFITLLQQLHAQNPTLTAVIIGSKEESALGLKLRRHTGDYCIDLTGKTSLVETWDLVSRSQWIVTNETGIAQMGAALNKQTFTLTGGGHWGRFVPLPEPSTLTPIHVERPCYNCNWQCIHPLKKGQTAPCLLDVSVAMVIRAISDTAPLAFSAPEVR